MPEGGPPLHRPQDVVLRTSQVSPDLEHVWERLVGVLSGPLVHSEEQRILEGRPFRRGSGPPNLRHRVGSAPLSGAGSSLRTPCGSSMTSSTPEARPGSPRSALRAARLSSFVSLRLAFAA